ncbi:hypothetical protein TVAG_388320 [Trichomonas vaginalis G3]|uniref:Importin N-terminal domain-containing protein n=1 Tax=Trichomonas vaginalis (strain ATCC PRA-98 / G3) TaxID=412133 RepID=A2DYG7_TRIV3|nr:armadillo (ARM) repeat-containing protein family [Trichomonas vaginalis G3]EAY14502.1 hypothetical protein TVAG_388320 [Trichomonas vaginalis G3]KAI5529325.1 armadillo (ARM) repeat-containing protein family [Trichomonas vaginalis G3]|eukprot:XP_001326725.1 hypothetical protein [Trichomonas vaginalis G3]
MDEDLDSIFALSLVPINEATSLATKRILEIMDDPQSIFSLIQHLKSNKDKTIRQQIAITISKMAERHAKYYIHSDSFVKIKEILLNTILFEKDQIIKGKLLNSIVSLFKETQANWDELFNFIQKRLKNNTDLDLLLFFDIFRRLLPLVTPESISQLFGDFVSNNLKNPKAIAGNTLIEMMVLVIELKKYIKVSPEALNDIYIIAKEQIFNISQENYNDKLGALCDAFLDFISAYIEFTDFDDVFELITKILDEESISVDNKILILPILEPIINYSDNNEKISFQQLILIILKFITIISSEYDLNDINNYFPEELVATISKKCPQLEFYQYIVEALKSGDVSDIAVLFLLMYALQDIQLAIQRNILDVFQFIQKNVNNESLDNVKISLMLLKEIFDCRFQELEKISVGCNEMFLKLLETQDNDTLMLTLKAFTSYFSAVPINPTDFSSLYTGLIKLLHENELPSAYLGFDCIKELINSAQDCVTLHLPDIYYNLKEFAANDNAYNCIRSSSIESLGLLLGAGKSVDEPILDDYFALIFGILDSNPNKISPFFTECLESLAKTCKIKVLEIGTIIDRIIYAMQQNDSDYIASSLKFLKSYFKYCKIEDVSGHYDILKNILLEYFQSDSDYDVLSLNIKAIFRFTVLFGKIDEDFLTTIMSFADNIELLSLFLYFFREIFESEIEVSNEVIGLYLQCTLNVISPSFEDEEIKNDGFNSFSRFAIKHPDKFLYADFYNICIEYFQNNENSEWILECTGIYSILFQPNLGESFIKDISDIFFGTLKYCDFIVMPHNLIGIEKYINAGFVPDQEKITQLIESANLVYSSEYCGEKNYYLTIYGFNLVMFSAFSHLEFDISIVSEFLPKMFEKSNDLNFQSESDNLFQNVVKVCYKYSDIVKDFGQQVIDFFMKPLTCSIQIFKKLNLSSETLHSISSYLGDCINSDSNCAVYINNLLEDPVICERFVERSGISLTK